MSDTLSNLDLATRFVMRCLAALLMFVIWTAPVQADDASPQPDRPIIAAMFSSAFCGACLIMNPRVDDVKEDFEGRPVEFIKLDQTASLVTGRRLTRLAEEKGIADAWEQYRGGTGFLLLIDPADGVVLDMLTISDTTYDISLRIHEALRSET